MQHLCGLCLGCCDPVFANNYMERCESLLEIVCLLRQGGWKQLASCCAVHIRIPGIARGPTNYK